MKLSLLRHCKTQNNIDGLTQPVDGISCIPNELFTFICSNEILENLSKRVLVLCANSIRAIETLSPLINDANEFGITMLVQHNDDLLEVDFGKFVNQPEDTVINGLTMQDYRDRTVQFYLGNIDDIRYPDGESLNEIALRVRKVIGEIKRYQASKLFDEILIVGHNRLFRHLVVQMGLVKPSEMFNSKFRHGELTTYNI